ncbi:tRNA-ribosyltransferase, partial [Halorubrum sp. C3]
MTDYFEVHERDGAARLGAVRLADPVTTPALADPFLDDAGSLWAGDREVPEGDESALTVLPHRSFPAGTRDEVRESFAVEHPDAEFPSAAVVDSRSARDLGADAYLLSDAEGFVGHGEAFRDAIVRAKESLPPDAALGLSGVATPRNVAVLAYAGVDLVDETLARTKGTQGMYLTADAAHFLEDLDELPCACPACAKSRSEFTRADCADHNANALRAELRRVRERIRSGRLRDYIEAQARHEGWLTAAFREFDDQWGYVEERTPLMRDAEVTAASAETLDRVEIRRFADRVTSRYRNRFTDQPLVLVPCSATKPYSDSQSHRQFHDAIQWRGHTVSMTSPIGVVPQELETTYPA